MAATFSKNSVRTMNAIRDNMPSAFQATVPVLDGSPEALSAFYGTMLENVNFRNAFVNLINLIGIQYVQSRTYETRFTPFNRGFMPNGASVEEIAVDIAGVVRYNINEDFEKTHEYNPPDVKSALHFLDYQVRYPFTISYDMLRMASRSYDGVETLVQGIFTSVINSANYDIDQACKYRIAYGLLNGQIPTVDISAMLPASPTKDDYENVVAIGREYSNNFEIFSPDYTAAGNYSVSGKDRQYYIVSTAFEAQMGVKVIAQAFNRDEVDYMGRRVLIDGFGRLDTQRLNTLFADVPGYEEIGSSDLEALNKVPLAVVDRDFLMMWDYVNEFANNYSNSGLGYNYNYHVWKVIGLSPFVNQVAFDGNAQAVNTVTVTPASASLAVGGTLQLTATVDSTGFPSHKVTWTSDNANVTVDSNGFVKVNAGASGTANITATSVANSGKTGKCTITISA